MATEAEIAAMRRPKPEPEEPVTVPAVTVAQRILPIEAMAAKSFPSSPRRTWKAALALEDAKVAMSFAVGPLMSSTFSKVLQEKCPSLVLWVVSPKGRLQASWLQRDGSWKFDDGWQFWPSVQKLTHAEVMEWLT